MAIGARAGDIDRRAGGKRLSDGYGRRGDRSRNWLDLGAIIQALLYKGKPSEPTMIGVRLTVILAAMLLATLPAAMRAIRTDPVESLRTK